MFVSVQQWFVVLVGVENVCIVVFFMVSFKLDEEVLEVVCDFSCLGVFVQVVDICFGEVNSVVVVQMLESFMGFWFFGGDQLCLFMLLVGICVLQIIELCYVVGVVVGGMLVGVLVMSWLMFIGKWWVLCNFDEEEQVNIV